MNKQQLLMIRFAKQHGWYLSSYTKGVGLVINHRHGSPEFFLNIDELRLWAGY